MSLSTLRILHTLPCPNGLGRVEFSSFGPYSSYGPYSLYGPYRLVTVRKTEVTVRKLHVINDTLNITLLCPNVPGRVEFSSHGP